MYIRLLEIVRAVQRIKPGVKEEFAPISPSDDETAWGQPISVLREHEIDLVPFQVRERLDNTVRWDNRLILEHLALQTLRGHNVAFNRQVWIHDQRVLVKIPEISAVREFGHCVSHSWYFCPRAGRSVQFVVRRRWEECCVSYNQSVPSLTFVDRMLFLPCFLAYSIRFSLTLSMYSLL